MFAKSKSVRFGLPLISINPPIEFRLANVGIAVKLALLLKNNPSPIEVRFEKDGKGLTNV